MHIRIERARPEDGPAIIRLLTENALPTAGALDHLSTAVVARGDAGIVGSAMLELYDDGALLRSVAVASAARNAGIGLRLTESALQMATDLAVSDVYLLTTTAERFFPKFAFREIPREAVPVSVRESIEFREACPSTAIVMRKTLLPSI